MVFGRVSIFNWRIRDQGRLVDNLPGRTHRLKGESKGRRVSERVRSVPPCRPASGAKSQCTIRNRESYHVGIKMLKGLMSK